MMGSRYRSENENLRAHIATLRAVVGILAFITLAMAYGWNRAVDGSNFLTLFASVLVVFAAAHFQPGPISWERVRCSTASLKVHAATNVFV